jgi:uncharacterized protein YoxC
MLTLDQAMVALGVLISVICGYVWRRVEKTAAKVDALEAQMLGEYHNKEDLRAMLNDVLAPINQQLANLNECMKLLAAQAGVTVFGLGSSK